MAKVIDADEVERTRTPEQREAWARVLKQIEEQGIQPMTEEKLDAMAGVWPEDEEVDEFLEARERWRNESHRRELP
jgi:hypothetical protein